MRLTWAQPEDLLAHELVQSEAEGKDISGIKAQWIAAGGDPIPAVSGASNVAAPPQLRQKARELLAELDQLQPLTETADPQTWPQLFDTLPLKTTTPNMPINLQQLPERIEGAWVGRAAGCLLGKPVEKIPRQGIEEILRTTGTWPLSGWFTAEGLTSSVAERWPWNRRSSPTSLAENIAGMPEDDDLNYPIMALALLEENGAEFTTDDVATLWLNWLPAGRAFTAERAAYRNLLDARPAPESATHLNPFREWIGALIRTDVYGWTNPTSLEQAIHLAWKDARLSHTRNGIYGAMWAAALTWASLRANTATEALDLAGLAVPAESELATAIAFGRQVGGECDLSENGIKTALDQLHYQYGHLHWVHVLNNAAVIAFALEAGKTDFQTSICLAVLAGWDTDSVGATVGSVVGALNRGKIDPYWVSPLQGTIATSLPSPGVNNGKMQIIELVARTLKLAENSLKQ